MLFFLVVFQANAESSVTVDVGTDEQGSKNSSVAVNLARANDKEVMFGFGSGTVLTSAEPINNNFAYFGVSKKVSKDWKVTGLVDYSDLKDTYSMVSASVPVRYIQDSYYVELVPALRSIRLSTTTKKDLNVGSTALGIKSGVYLGKYFRLSGSAYSYTYSQDVSKIPSIGRGIFFSDNTLLLSSGLLNKSYNIETGLDFESLSVSLGKNSSVSATDNTNSDDMYVVLDYYLSKSWSISALLGKYLDVPKDQDNYSSIAVSYSF